MWNFNGNTRYEVWKTDIQLTKIFISALNYDLSRIYSPFTRYQECIQTKIMDHFGWTSINIFKKQIIALFIDTNFKKLVKNIRQIWGLWVSAAASGGFA